MVGETVKSNMKARMENTKGTAKGIVSDLRAIGEDIKKRVVDGSEPTFSKKYKGMGIGEVGSIPADILALPTAVADRLETHVQKFAQINRTWLKR